MDQPTSHLPKLNPLALPSQTTVLFAVIVFVFLAAVLSGAIGLSLFCVTLFLLSVFFLVSHMHTRFGLIKVALVIIMYATGSHTEC
jgi:hypothetical protein